MTEAFDIAIREAQFVGNDSLLGLFGSGEWRAPWIVAYTRWLRLAQWLGTGALGD